MDFMLDDELLDASMLASVLKMKPGTVLAYNSKEPSRLPPSIKLGRLVRWRKSDVTRWLADLDTGQMPVKRAPGRPRKR